MSDGIKTLVRSVLNETHPQLGSLACATSNSGRTQDGEAFGCARAKSRLVHRLTATNTLLSAGVYVPSDAVRRRRGPRPHPFS